MPSTQKAVGFGANYSLNMGPAQRSMLQHSDEEDVNGFLLEKTPWEKDDDELVQIATTVSSSLFLTSSGKIFTCGTLHGTVRPNLTRTVIQLPLKCVEIAAGRHFGLARMEGGLAVCSWGAGHFGQLALGGDSAPFIEHPTVVESLLPHVVGAPISGISAGYWHAMAVTEAGAVYSWGCNRNAQCGFKPNKDPPTLCAPQLVRFETNPVPKIVKVAGGRSHSVALDEGGKVYCWGACQYGQCGVITRRRGGVAPPKQVEALVQVQIADIAAGDTHTLALTGGGRVFGFGSGFEGQLGTGASIQMNPKPKLVGDLDFVAIQAGQEWKMQQKQKQQGDDTLPEAPLDTSPSETPHSSLAQVPKIVSVHATGNCSMAVSSKGHLYVWGCNDVGNLGVPKPDPATLPHAEPGVPPSKTTTLRQFHTQSFDSSHNVGLPQRVDCLASMNISSIAASPTFLWCVGSQRAADDIDPKAVGRTLYEIQEAKRQKSLRLNRKEASLKKRDSDRDDTNEDLATAKAMDPPEMKDGSQVELLARKNAALAKEAAKTRTKIEEQPEKEQGALPPKSSNALKGKRRFSIPKAIGKMVRRASAK